MTGHGSLCLSLAWSHIRMRSCIAEKNLPHTTGRRYDPLEPIRGLR
jgi:hypothetical protein